MINSNKFLKVWAAISIAVSMVFADVQINAANFPDENFRKWILEQRWDNDGVITDTKIAEITSISISDENISDLKGIEYFTALKELYCGFNQLTSLDVSKNTLLEILVCHSNKLTSIDLSSNTALTQLECVYNRLTSIDVSGFISLNYFIAYNNRITSIDVTKNAALKTLVIHNNFLTSLDVSNNGDLENLVCYNNMIANLPTNPEVTGSWQTTPQNGKRLELTEDFPDENFRAEISRIFGLTTDTISYGIISKLDSLILKDKGITDLSGIEFFASLEFLDVSNSQAAEGRSAKTRESLDRNKITELDLSRNIKLQELNVSNNELTELDLSNNLELVKLDASGNDLRAIDVSFNRKLEELNLSRNLLLTTIDVSENEKLEILDLSGSGITTREAITGIDNTKVDVENLNLPTSTGRPSATRKMSSFAFAGVGNGQINLRLQAGNYTVELYNLQGCKIRSVNINAINGINATGLKVDGLSSGIFVLNVKQQGVLVLRHKLTLR
jgi:Leucine-rich repeat (LRR) protein